MNPQETLLCPIDNILGTLVGDWLAIDAGYIGEEQLATLWQNVATGQELVTLNNQ